MRVFRCVAGGVVIASTHPAVPLASGSIDGAIRLWDSTVNYATDWICSAAGDLTSLQWQTYIQELSYQQLCTN